MTAPARHLRSAQACFVSPLGRPVGRLQDQIQPGCSRGQTDAKDPVQGR